MKYLTSLLVVIILISPFISLAQSVQEDRRIEEQKRQDLKPTETIASKAQKQVKKGTDSSLDLVDRTYLMEFLLKRVTFRYDLCKVLMLLLSLENEYIDLDSQIVFLKENKLLPKKIAKDFKPMEPLRKGVAAYAFYRVLDIKGGIIIRVFGTSQRYALEELAYQGIMPSGNVNDIVSGDELISILNQAAKHLPKKSRVN